MTPYTPVYAEWEDLPDRTTPITAEALQAIDDALVGATTDIDSLSADKVPTSRIITAGNGLSGTGALTGDITLLVNVDGTTIEINADVLRVKANGISANELADNAVDAAAISAGVIGTSKLSFFPNMFPGLRPGAYYTSQSVGGQGISDLVVTEALVYFTPIFINKATALTAVGFSLKGNGGTAEVVRVGIYNDDGFGAPSTVLLDAGTASVSAGANALVTIAVNITLQPGLYWLAIVAQGASGTPPTLAAIDFPCPSPMEVISTTVYTSCVGYTLASVTGAFATTAYASLTKTTSKCAAVVIKPV